MALPFSIISCRSDSARVTFVVALPLLLACCSCPNIPRTVVPYRFLGVLFFFVRFRRGTQFNQPHAYRLPYHARQDAARDGTSNQSPHGPPMPGVFQKPNATNRQVTGARGLQRKIRVQLHRACAVQTAATLLRSEPQEIACIAALTRRNHLLL